MRLSECAVFPMTVSDTSQVEKNKQKHAAVHFLQLIVAGDVDEAYHKYVNMNGKHYNPFFPAGLPALQKAMAENNLEYPHKRLKVRNVLGDGDLVAVHSHLIMKSGELGMSVVHLFRFDVSGRVAELWDCSQELPKDSPNEDGMF